MKSSQRGRLNILWADLAGFKNLTAYIGKIWHLETSYAGSTVYPSAYK
jgi:hypothetical protein